MFSSWFSLIFQIFFIAIAASFCQLLAFKCHASTTGFPRCRRSLCVYNDPRGDHFEAKGLLMASTFYWGLRLGADPAFHVTTVILVPLGPSVFKNMIFSMMIGYFSVFSVFRCAMFYMSFLSHLLKKLSKRPAVEPSDFWENRTRFQKQCFFLFCFFTFAFFILFHIFVNFRLPLPTPLAQIGLICVRFWFHV